MRTEPFFQCLVFIAVGLLAVTFVSAQPTVRLTDIPGVQQKLDLGDLRERVSVLDLLVVTKRQNDIFVTELPYLLSKDTGIPVLLEFKPGVDVAKRSPLSSPYMDTQGYPWAYSPGMWSLLDGLREFPIIISDGTLPENFTVIFDNKRVRILTVEKAVSWWKEKILVSK